MADGLNKHEEAALHALRALVAEDAGLGREIAALPWVVDDITEEAGEGLGRLASLAKQDASLARSVSDAPWFLDGLTVEEGKALTHLSRIAEKDAGLARTIFGLPWMNDSISGPETKALQNIAALAHRDLSVAGNIVALPWVIDDITETEWAPLASLARLYDQGVLPPDPPVGFRWLTDDMTEREGWALYYLAQLAEKNPALVERLIRLPWVGDAISEDEQWALRTLEHLAAEDLGLANQLVGMPFLTESFEQHDRHALRSLLNLYLNYTGEYQKLTSQDWFADGLDDLEASFVMVFGAAGTQLTPRDLRDLIVTRHSESRTIDLPLAGQVQLTFFQSSDDPQNRKIVQQIEDAIREIERFINVPFPLDEVTLLFASPGESAFSENKLLGLNRGTHLVVDPGLARQGDTNRTIVHEIGHYYWTGASRDQPVGGVPLWFQEGGADFLASYVRDRLFDDPLATRKRTVEQRNIRNCVVSGINDIQRLIDKLDESGYSDHSASQFFICNYYYGEALFHNLFDSLGEEAFRHAWTEIYQLTQSEARPVTEIEVYQAFRTNAPLGQLTELDRVYQQWHGRDIPE